MVHQGSAARLADDASVLAAQLHLDGNHAGLLADADARVATSKAAGMPAIVSFLRLQTMIQSYFYICTVTLRAHNKDVAMLVGLVSISAL